MAKLTHDQSHTIEQRKRAQQRSNSPIVLARLSMARADKHRQHHIIQACCGIPMDLHRPLKEAHNTCTCYRATLRFGHN